MLALLSAKVKMFFVAARLSLTLVWVVVLVLVQTYTFWIFEHILLLFCKLDNQDFSIFPKFEFSKESIFHKRIQIFNIKKYFQKDIKKSN